MKIKYSSYVNKEETNIIYLVSIKTGSNFREADPIWITELWKELNKDVKRITNEEGNLEGDFLEDLMEFVEKYGHSVCYNKVFKHPGSGKELAMVIIDHDNIRHNAENLKISYESLLFDVLCNISNDIIKGLEIKDRSPKVALRIRLYEFFTDLNY